MMIPLDLIDPHPRNPRLAPDSELVDRLAAGMRERGSMDEAYAILVRPLGDRFQVVSGHHRRLAALAAGLAEVPAHVREMDDEEAYLELVLANRQSELHPVWEGMHALGYLEGNGVELGKRGPQAEGGLDAYAAKLVVKRQTLQHKVRAAEVWRSLPHAGQTIPPKDCTRALSALRSAPPWLWSSLRDRFLAEGWSLGEAEAQAKKFASLPKGDKNSPLPDWLDREAFAEALVSGATKPPVLSQMIEEVKTAAVQADDLRVALYKRLNEARPSKLSAVQAIVAELGREQAARDAEARAEERKKQQEKEENETRTARLRAACTLSEWGTLSADEKTMLLDTGDTTGTFNKQGDNPSIEWAQYSWNPVSGCLHDCSYCYARDIANSDRMKKVYPAGFEPTLHPRTLLALRGKHPPGVATFDTREKNVFTCSMADLFGRWVPEEWIEAVFREMRSAAAWNFLCLTKFPKRMAEFAIPDNAWMGTTVDLQARVPAAEAAFARVEAGVRWLSVEPMLEPLRFKRLDLFQWVVIGGASRSSQTPEWRPPYAWIHDLVQQARDAGCKVYFKTNLLGSPVRIMELPFDAPIKAEKAELPEVFRYLGRTKGSIGSMEEVAQGNGHDAEERDGAGLTAGQRAARAVLDGGTKEAAEAHGASWPTVKQAAQVRKADAAMFAMVVAGTVSPSYALKALARERSGEGAGP